MKISIKTTFWDKPMDEVREDLVRTIFWIGWFMFINALVFFYFKHYFSALFNLTLWLVTYFINKSHKKKYIIPKIYEGFNK